MNADVLIRYEATSLTEILYSLKAGVASYFRVASDTATRVPEKVVSKPATPQFYELLIPVFRFIGYPGGKAVLTPTSVAAAEARIEQAGLKEAWDAHHAGRSGLVYQTKQTGYIERAPRVSKEVAVAAEILVSEVGVAREPALEPRIMNPASMTYRVFSSELSDEHVDTLKAHAESGEPIKFKGQPHTVRAVMGNWNIIFNRFDVNYDLEKAKK